MAELTAEIWHWTAFGMRRNYDSNEGWISRREAEKLCEEAHRRGYAQGLVAGEEHNLERLHR